MEEAAKGASTVGGGKASRSRCSELRRSSNTPRVFDAPGSQCRLELVGGGCRAVLGTTAASIPHPARAPVLYRLGSKQPYRLLGSYTVVRVKPCALNPDWTCRWFHLFGQLFKISLSLTCLTTSRLGIGLIVDQARSPSTKHSLSSLLSSSGEVYMFDRQVCSQVDTDAKTVCALPHTTASQQL